MKPKLWNGPNPVGEAKARELARLDAPYLTASGPGFEAKKAGAFSSVIGAVSGKPESPPDGWYSHAITATDFTRSSLVRTKRSFATAKRSYKSASLRERRFRARGDLIFPVGASCAQLVTFGAGKCYMAAMADYHFTNYAYDVFLYRVHPNARVDAVAQITVEDPLGNVNSATEPYALLCDWREVYVGGPYLLVTSIRYGIKGGSPHSVLAIVPVTAHTEAYVAGEEDPTSDVSGGGYNDLREFNGEGVEVPAYVLPTDGDWFVMPSTLTVTMPRIWVLSVGASSADLPYLCIRQGLTGPWTWFSCAGMLNRVISAAPGSGGYLERLMMEHNADASYAAALAEDPFTSREEYAKRAVPRRNGVTAQMRLYALSARRVLCVFKFFLDYDTRHALNLGSENIDYAIGRAVVDITNGRVLSCDAVNGYEPPVVHVLGKDKWLYIEHGGRYPDVQVTYDAGLTYSRPPVPKGLFGSVVAIVPKDAWDEHSEVRIYFVNLWERGYSTSQTLWDGVRRLYYTDDMFATHALAADVTPEEDLRAPPLYVDGGKYAYADVKWVGSPEAPAPIDPVFPWRVDTRFKAPDWWMDGVEA